MEAVKSIRHGLPCTRTPPTLGQPATEAAGHILPIVSLRIAFLPAYITFRR